MEFTRNLMIESVSRLQPTAAHIIGLRGSVAEGVDQLRRSRVGCLLVTEGRQLVGIFTERDLLKKILAPGLPLDTRISAVMTANPVSVNVKDSIRIAVERMQTGGYRHLPVVDEANHPVGVLSAKRIVQYLVEHFPSTVYNQPPDPNSIPDTAEGA
jgi:CBS domain-containing protein